MWNNHINSYKSEAIWIVKEMLIRFMNIGNQFLMNDGAYSCIETKKLGDSSKLLLCHFFCELAIVEVGIESILAHEFLVVALLDNISIFHHEN